MQIAGKPLIAWSILLALRVRPHHPASSSARTTTRSHRSPNSGAPRCPSFVHRVLRRTSPPTSTCFRHALEFLDHREAYRPDLVVSPRPNGPVRRVADVNAPSICWHVTPEADAVRSVSLAHQTPYKMWLLHDDGTMAPLHSSPGSARLPVAGTSAASARLRAERLCGTCFVRGRCSRRSRCGRLTCALVHRRDRDTAVRPRLTRRHLAGGAGSAGLEQGLDIPRNAAGPTPV